MAKTAATSGPPAPWSGGNLLIVANFPAGTGYAWNTIEEYFLSIGRVFLDSGRRAIVCYPEVNGVPARYRDTGIEIVKFDFSKSGAADLCRFIRRHGIRTVYLTDRPAFSPRYFLCRLAGARTIIIHERTSGHREAPGPLKKMAKKALNRYPLMSADLMIAVSEFVRKRLRDVSCLPEGRIRRVWNGIDIERFSPSEDDFVNRKYNIPRKSKIVFSYSRANRYKGIETLIDAADLIVNGKGRTDLVFLFCGDGPDLQGFLAYASKKRLEGHFLFPGKTDEIDRILKGAAVIVVPSLWQESFGLSVVEGMGTGKTVIASRVGGIVDIITDGKDGFMFEPGDSLGLASLILSVSDDPDLQKSIGENARRTVVEKFNIEDKKLELAALFKKHCGLS